MPLDDTTKHYEQARLSTRQAVEAAISASKSPGTWAALARAEALAKSEAGGTP
jgi:hypothetical protein